jgi:hypothetical protein
VDLTTVSVAVETPANSTLFTSRTHVDEPTASRSHWNESGALPRAMTENEAPLPVVTVRGTGGASMIGGLGGSGGPDTRAQDNSEVTVTSRGGPCIRPEPDSAIIEFPDARNGVTSLNAGIWPSTSSTRTMNAPRYNIVR